MYSLYLPYDLFLNESVFITINNFLLLAVVNILTLSRAGWKIAVSTNEQILQHIVDNITG